jgi:orotidine 5'-phosphate decarboxylase subfamily 1
MVDISTRLSFKDREKLAINPTAKKLFKLMAEKQTNLAVNGDVTTTKQLLWLADLVGPHICVLKTHVDILRDFDSSTPVALKKLATKHNFLIFEDRKFADIGAVVKMQYLEGLYRIASWADITNAHPIPGPGVIAGLEAIGQPLGRGLLLVAEMSSQGSLAHGSYTEAAVEMARKHAGFVMGFITQRRLTDDPHFINFTPGVNLKKEGDTLGQQYNTPEKVIKEKGSDVIIVGRGILEATDPSSEAELYRKAGWEALL